VTHLSVHGSLVTERDLMDITKEYIQDDAADGRSTLVVAGR